MEIIKPGLNYYINRMDSEFAFVRYGDGEFNSILGQIKGHNCDGHNYFPALGQGLRKSLIGQDDNYVRAIGWLALEGKNESRVVNYLKENKLTYDWHDTDVFLKASLAGQLNPFIKKIRKYKGLYVCPAHLKPLAENELGFDTLDIPYKNMFLHINQIQERLLDKIDKYELVCFSGGMPAKILIHKMWFEFGKRGIFLDIGSTFDGYVKRHSRTHTKQLTKEIIQTNLQR